MTPQQLKKALAAAGFEVFRTLGEDIVLADRVRENLIMDSGVRLRSGEPLQVRIVMRAQRSDFPSDEEATLFDRVRSLAEPATSQGFLEVSTVATKMTDPSDAEHTLDTFYEVLFAKEVDGLESAYAGLKFAMGLEKTAHSVGDKR